MNVFMYNNLTKVLELNEPEILLIKEFNDLYKRDKSKSKDRAWAEFTYIYLAIDWKSPYNQYTEQEKHEEALNDSGLTEEKFNDPIFRAACRKYRALQDSNKWTQKDDKKLLNYRLKGTKTSAEKKDSIAVQRKWNRLPEKEKAKYEVQEQKCGGKTKKRLFGGIF